jgi:hypothetical protein
MKPNQKPKRRYLVKRVHGNLYFRLDMVHRPDISLDPGQKAFVATCLGLVPRDFEWTLCRISEDLSSASFMVYDWTLPNPALKHSIKVNAPAMTVSKVRNHGGSAILHLAELYFPDGSPEHAFYKENGEKYRAGNNHKIDEFIATGDVE